MANHAGYNDRIDFVHSVLCDHFGLPRGLAKVDPIAYDEDCPFPYNNFVYSIILPAGSQLHPPDKAIARIGWSPVPPGITQFALRLANAAAFGVGSPNRVENEVATLHLISTALRPLGRTLVPTVYGWGSAADGSQGWILQDFMPGIDLDTVLPEMKEDQRDSTLAEVAEIVAAIQKFPLPSTITKFGGLTLDSNDNIVSAPAPPGGDGPWDSYEDYYTDRVKAAIAEADASPHIAGWRDNGVRESLDSFLDGGLATVFQSLASKDDKVIVHGDFTPNNLLYDPGAGHITALLDYDFSIVSHPSFEFLRSFDGLGGPYRGLSSADNEEQRELQEAKLLGFPPHLSAPSGQPSEDWTLAKGFEEALERFHVRRPSTIVGYQSIAGLESLLDQIAPWRLIEPRVLERQTEDAIRSFKANCEQQLLELLQKLKHNR